MRRSQEEQADAQRYAEDAVLIGEEGATILTELDRSFQVVEI